MQGEVRTKIAAFTSTLPDRQKKGWEVMDKPSVWFNLISLPPVVLVSARAIPPIGAWGDIQHA